MLHVLYRLIIYIKMAFRKGARLPVTRLARGVFSRGVVLRAQCTSRSMETRMWANAQPDGRPAEHRWRPLFNAAKFG